MTTQMNNLNEQLFQEIDNEAGEKFNGGSEVFTIANQTSANVGYSLDRRSQRQLPGRVLTWTAYSGGIIIFDRDVRATVESYKRYNLADGRLYAFRPNRRTPGNPYDIDIYDIS